MKLYPHPYPLLLPDNLSLFYHVKTEKIKLIKLLNY